MSDEERPHDRPYIPVPGYGPPDSEGRRVYVGEVILVAEAPGWYKISIAYPWGESHQMQVRAHGEQPTWPG